MTISLNTAAPAKAAAGDAAPNAAADKSPEFAKLIDRADAKGAVDTPSEVPPAATPPADQSLEALLQTLRVALSPTALLPVTSKKPGDPDNVAATKDKPAKDGEEENASTGLAALSFPALQLSSAVRDAVKPTMQSIDDILSKPATRGSLSADASVLPLPTPMPADFAALTDASAVKALDQSAPANATIDRLVDTARDAAWLDRLSRDIADSAGTGDRVRFRMLPPSLGALDVSVERQAAGLSVSMTTHTPEARNLIAEARQQMVDGLKAQGVPLIQLSLATAGEEQAGHRPPTFFNHLIEVAAPAGTELAGCLVETMAERIDRFA